MDRPPDPPHYPKPLFPPPPPFTIVSEYSTARNIHLQNHGFIYTKLPGEIVQVHVHACFNERRKKEGRSKHGQTNNKAKQHSTPKAVTFPKKNELPRVGLEPTTLYALDRVLYQLISHLIVCTCTVAYIWDVCCRE